MTGAVHVIGAGLSGLAAAVALVQAGRRVTLWEASPRAGGRCRSFEDRQLGATLDNGTHLALSGNRSLARFLALTGGADRLHRYRPATLPFCDLESGGRWCLRPGLAGLLSAKGRPPGVSAVDLLADVARLFGVGIAGRRHTATVAAALRHSRPAALRGLWAPLTIAALNTTPDQAAAVLLGAVVRETLLRGETACRPMLPQISLDHAYIEPAVAALRAGGASLRFHTRVGALGLAGRRVISVNEVPVAPGDDVIVALPPWVVGDLLPGVLPTLWPGASVPPPGQTIVNVHFRPERGGEILTESLPDSLPILGLIGGRADWLFRRGGILSVTVSAADDLVGIGAEDIAKRLWADISKALPGLSSAKPPPYRVLKERRATFAAIPAVLRQRPPCRSDISNLFFAGDWVDNGLPATMEGAVRSGFAAADAVLHG